MKIEIDLTKTIQENANDYYSKSKKAKKKLAGLKTGVIELERKLETEQKNKPKEKKLIKKRERKWFEKYHWFYTSEGFLVVSGRDAKSNEIVVKKTMEKHDLYFHADIQGAPHTILKTNDKNPGEKSKQETAVFAAVFSKAWREQLPGIDVYSASPEQVTKKAPSGESLGTGAFMIYGKRDWYKKTPLEFAIGIKKEKDSYELLSGPYSAIKVNSDFMLKVSFGKDSKGDASKKIRQKFSEKFKEADLNLDDISALLPSGGLKIEN